LGGVKRCGRGWSRRDGFRFRVWDCAEFGARWNAGVGSVRAPVAGCGFRFRVWGAWFGRERLSCRPAG